MAAPMRTKKSSMKNRKQKVILEFDEKARADYLKGFQKRKTERKLAAIEKKDKLIKEERILLRKQIRELKAANGTTKSEMMIPELEQLVEPEVFDLPDHTVTIANIGQVDFVGKTGLRLGQNTGEIPSDTEDKEQPIDKPGKGGDATSKSLMRKLASCSNQLSSQTMNSKKANRKQRVKAKLQAKKVKRKKNKTNKPRKR